MKTWKMIRKGLSLLAAVTLAAAVSGPVRESRAEAAGDGELTVGHTTSLTGDFLFGSFGNGAADVEVRAMIHGCNLVAPDQYQSMFMLDETVVRKTMVSMDEEGNKTYYIVLEDDMRYSDGTPITAWDYAFAMLLKLSPQFARIGGRTDQSGYIAGAVEYSSGQLPYLTGIGVLDDYQLSITLDHQYLPYYYELALLSCFPLPIQEIAPGCKVYAGSASAQGNGYGYGVHIGAADPAEKENPFTAELLKKTLLDPVNGYLSHPKIVSGPYTLASFDGETCHFVLNPNYKGAWVFGDRAAEAEKSLSEGLDESLAQEFEEIAEESFGDEGEEIEFEDDGEAEELTEETEEVKPNYIAVSRLDASNKEKTIYLVKPTIEKICFTMVDNDTATEKLLNGEVQLLNKVTYAPVISTLTDAAARDLARFQSYPRTGMTFISFSFENPTVEDKEVRQAIAWCMDRDQLTKDYCGDFGVRVDGLYGLEEWEYLICNGQLEYPIYTDTETEFSDEEKLEMSEHRFMYATSDSELQAAQLMWEALSLEKLTTYAVDENKAQNLLMGAGWTLNREGETFDPEKDDVRCKEIDGALVPLELTLMVPEGNHIVDTMQENFIDHLNHCGISLTIVQASMDEVLKNYYRIIPRTVDMIYLGTNFDAIFDPSTLYSAMGEEGVRQWNNTYSNDEALYDIAVEMRTTDSRDTYDYVSKWVDFQERYNEVLPSLPIYSNIYFDFFSTELKNYYSTSHIIWPYAILESSYGTVGTEAGE